MTTAIRRVKTFDDTCRYGDLNPSKQYYDNYRNIRFQDNDMLDRSYNNSSKGNGSVNAKNTHNNISKVNTKAIRRANTCDDTCHYAEFNSSKQYNENCMNDRRSMSINISNDTFCNEILPYDRFQDNDKLDMPRNDRLDDNESVTAVNYYNTNNINNSNNASIKNNANSKNNNDSNISRRNDTHPFELYNSGAKNRNDSHCNLSNNNNTSNSKNEENNRQNTSDNHRYTIKKRHSVYDIRHPLADRLASRNMSLDGALPGLPGPSTLGNLEKLTEETEDEDEPVPKFLPKLKHQDQFSEISETESNIKRLEQEFQHLEYLLDALTEMFVSSMEDQTQDFDESEHLIDQVYTLAVAATECTSHLRLLAEALHKKWLSEPGFAPVAARICHRLRDLSADEMPFWSIVYGIVWKDFQDRKSVRKMSHTLFANNAHFAHEFFRLFYQWEVDSVFRPLIECLFRYAGELLDEFSTEDEIRTFHTIYLKQGSDFNQIDPGRTADVMVQVRKRLIEYSASPYCRSQLLEILEYYERQWDSTVLATPVKRLFKMYSVAKRNNKPKDRNRNEEPSKLNQSK